MSMHVDYSTPLTNEERAYLELRGKYHDIERVDSAHSVETPAYGVGDGTGTTPVSLLSSDQAAGRKAALLAELARIEEAEKASGAPGTDEDVTAAPYEEWSVDDLKAEIDVRNADKAEGDKIAKTGGVKVLADRLYADDEANA
jgi:hypothetical protein